MRRLSNPENWDTEPGAKTSDVRTGQSSSVWEAVDATPWMQQDRNPRDVGFFFPSLKKVLGFCPSWRGAIILRHECINSGAYRLKSRTVNP